MIHHIPGMDPIGLLEKYGRNFIRPHLRIEHGGDRAIEIVSVHYPIAQSQSFNFQNSTASFNVSGGTASGRSRYIRVWVFNSWGFPAHRAEVYVDRISCDGKVLESERSPMHWSDFKEAFEYPKPMRSGHQNGWYVDICAADSIDPRLQFLSLKGVERGYHKYSEEGIYTIELTAEASKPCKFDHLTLTVGHDGKNWEGLTVISAK
jgi:hypothetical protein